MMPEKVNNIGEARQVMKNIGIGNSFIDEMSNFVKPIASKFGMKSETIDRYSNELRDNSNSKSSSNNSSFNKNRYPKV